MKTTLLGDSSLPDGIAFGESSSYLSAGVAKEERLSVFVSTELYTYMKHSQQDVRMPPIG